MYSNLSSIVVSLNTLVNTYLSKESIQKSLVVYIKQKPSNSHFSYEIRTLRIIVREKYRYRLNANWSVENLVVYLK